MCRNVQYACKEYCQVYAWNRCKYLMGAWHARCYHTLVGCSVVRHYLLLVALPWRLLRACGLNGNPPRVGVSYVKAESPCEPIQSRRDDLRGWAKCESTGQARRLGVNRIGG